MQNHAEDFGGWLWETSSYNKTMATVAQLVERLCEEQEVDRSILSRCAKFHSQVHHRQVVSLLRSCMLVRVQPWEPSSE